MNSFSQYRNTGWTSSSQNNISKYQVIQRFKESEKQKSILKNKLNILQKQCQKNQSKTKSIQTSLKRVKKIKQNYKKSQEQIHQLIRKNKQKQDTKKQNVMIRKYQSRGKLPFIKASIQRQKSSEYLLVKKRSIDMQRKLKVYRNSIISERKKTARWIKQQQQMVPLNRTLYIQQKNKTVRIQKEQQALMIQRKFKKSRLQLEQMKNLEDSLLDKLNKSRTILNRSMSRLSGSIRG